MPSCRNNFFRRLISWKKFRIETVDTHEEFHTGQRASTPLGVPADAMFRFVSFSILKLVKNHRAYYFSIIYYFTHVYLNKKIKVLRKKKLSSGADLGGGCRGCAPPPWDDLRFSNTTGILQKKEKTMWFIGVEVEQETSAPPPKKNPGSAPALTIDSLTQSRAKRFEISIQAVQRTFKWNSNVSCKLNTDWTLPIWRLTASCEFVVSHGA